MTAPRGPRTSPRTRTSSTCSDAFSTAETIAAEHQKIFDTIYQGSRLEIQRVGSRAIGDDILLVHTTSTLHVPAGPRAGDTHAIQTKILRNGQILAFQNTIRTELAEFAEGDEDLAELSPLEWQHGNSS